MIKAKSISAVLFFISLFIFSNAHSQNSTESFEFEFEGKTLKGLIEKPKDLESKAIVIIIPGYGRTNFVNGRSYAKLRQNLIKSGLTVVFWDKMGCGESEGEFDAQQPVESSAHEAVKAINKIKSLNSLNSKKIGLWGLSRAGWICPLINEQYPIDFWISASGTNDKENYGYLIKSNLLINGQSEEEAERLYDSWMLGHKLYCTQSKYEDYFAAIQPLMQDSTYRALFGLKYKARVTEEDRVAYIKNQKSYTSKGHYDPQTGLWVYIEEFEQMLMKFNCPVLALFGANDSQVDWRKTKKLYEDAIGPNGKLEVEVFEQCNHSLQKCKTCAYREDLSDLKWQACDGYYEVMEDWLRRKGFVE